MHYYSLREFVRGGVSQNERNTKANMNRMLNIVMRTLAKYSNDFSQRNILVDKDLLISSFCPMNNNNKKYRNASNVEIDLQLQTTGAELNPPSPPRSTVGCVL